MVPSSEVVRHRTPESWSHKVSFVGKVKIGNEECTCTLITPDPNYPGFIRLWLNDYDRVVYARSSQWSGE